VIRTAAGIEFPGWDATRSNLIAEVEMTEEPELGVRHDEKCTHALGRLEYEVRDGEVVYGDAGPIQVMVTEEHVGSTTEPTPRDLRDATRRTCITPWGAGPQSGCAGRGEPGMKAGAGGKRDLTGEPP
jgi:hypothetical protein